MLNQQQLAALLIKVAVAASLASIVMRFGRFERMLLRNERTLQERLHLALIFSLLFGASAGVRILNNQYQAVDLAFEGAIIAGALGGYVSGLLTGIFVSLPDLFNGKYMSMPLFAAGGLLGAMIHDLAPRREDIWLFSPFVDLNLYRLLRQALRLNRNVIQRRVVELAAFNVACNALVLVAEALRWGVQLLGFRDHGAFNLFAGPLIHSPWAFILSAITTLFAVTLPIRVWGSFRNERQLESQHAHLIAARLAALTNQINPHFLFNTLNSIATLIRINPESARDMIYRLSKILRRLLRKTDSFSPLREEISFMDDYLAIEMVRFGEKLRFEKDIDPKTLDRPIPSMILQPIVENSIKHGLASKIEGGAVRIKTWLNDGKLNILIEDDGVGISESKQEQLFTSGIGISNVNERLRVLFGPRYRMEVESREGEGTQTLLEIPEGEETLSIWPTS